MRRTWHDGPAILAVAVVLVGSAVGCGGTGSGDTGSGASGAGGGGGGSEQDLDESVCDPATGATFSLDIDNAYFPMPVGKLLTFDGEEDGVAVHLVLEVTDETEMVSGVETRVVLETADEDGALHEIARNFFAGLDDGTICYFGETVEFYEDGMVVSTEGQWRAGEDGAKPGIFMPGKHVVGMSYDQEIAIGVSQDHAVIESVHEPFTVPAGTFEDTMDTEETSPLDPGVVESKRYAAGLGLIVSGPLLLTSSE
jgi:hypothetical protein